MPKCRTSRIAAVRWFITAHPQHFFGGGGELSKRAVALPLCQKMHFSLVRSEARPRRAWSGRKRHDCGFRGGAKRWRWGRWRDACSGAPRATGCCSCRFVGGGCGRGMHSASPTVDLPDNSSYRSCEISRSFADLTPIFAWLDWLLWSLMTRAQLCVGTSRGPRIAFILRICGGSTLAWDDYCRRRHSFSLPGRKLRLAAAIRCRLPEKMTERTDEGTWDQFPRGTLPSISLCRTASVAHLEMISLRRSP